MSMSSETRSRTEEEIRVLTTQLSELQEAINAVQARLAALTSELEEVRLAIETISNVDRFKQCEVLVALDRKGYAYIRAQLQSLDKVLVHVGQNLYVVVPIDKAKSILAERERELSNAIQETEVELRKLMEVYTQLQKRLQSHIAAMRSQQGVST